MSLASLAGFSDSHGVGTHTGHARTRALRVSDSDMKKPTQAQGQASWLQVLVHSGAPYIMHGIRGRRGNGRWSLGWAWRRAVAGPRGAAGWRQVGCHSVPLPEGLPTEASNLQALLSNNPPGPAGEQRAASAFTSPWSGENNLDVISSNVI